MTSPDLSATRSHSIAPPSSAMVHLSWVRLRNYPREYSAKIVLGVVELYPAEFGAPAGTPRFCRRLGSEGYVYTQRVSATSSDAMRWLAEVQTGRWRSPTEDGSFPFEDAERTRLVDGMKSTPEWPDFVTYHDDAELHLDFVPRVETQVRIHSVMCTEDSTLPSHRHWETIRDVTNQLLRTDLDEVPALIGSVHAIQYDPHLRELRMRLEQDPTTKEDKSIVVTPIFRTLASPEALNLRLYERRAVGDRLLHDGPFDDVVRIPLRESATRIGCEVSTACGQLLRVHPPAGFMRQFVLNTTIESGQRRRVELAADAHRTKPRMYDVPIQSTETNRWTGTPESSLRTAESRLIAAGVSRAESLGKRAAPQKFFVNQQVEAEDFVRRLIGQATNTLLLVDAYFGADDLPRISTAATRDKLPFRILTSAEHLKGAEQSESGASTVDRALNLKTAVEDLLRNDRTLRVDVRVMCGKSPAVHDRFLLINRDVWSIGSSMNALGGRATLVLRVPEPGELAEFLESIWKDATPLERWREDRMSAQAAGIGAESKC